MRMKIKLINICIRHMCKKAGEELSRKPLKKFQIKVIRREKKNHAPSKKRANKLSNDNDDSIFNIPHDIGMLHRSSVKIKKSQVHRDSTQNHKETVSIQSLRENENIESETLSKSRAMVVEGKKQCKENNDNVDELLHETPGKEISAKSCVEHNFLFNLRDTPLTSTSDNKECIAKPTTDNSKGPKTNQNTRENLKCNPINITETRFNELNMQMLSRRLHQQIFPNSENNSKLPQEKLKSLIKAIEASGMNVDEFNCLPDVNIDLPALEGKDIEEHFYNIAKDQTKVYMETIDKIMAGIPKMPKKWLLQEGWTRYSEDSIEHVEHPLESGIIFDVEVCMKEGPLPTLATAVTDKAWYGWVSKSLVEGNSIPVESRSFTTDVLIPMESTINEHGKKLTDSHKKPKIIIGHNVSFDRQRIKEQYWLNCTGARFVDTMSLHVAVSGLNSYQRAILKSEKSEIAKEPWENVTSLNSLTDVYRLYCNDELDKKARNVFVDGTLTEVREQFGDLMNYCALDVEATHRIFVKLFPMFKERFPHPVTLAGILELGSAYLPVNSNWQRYIEESESTFEDVNYEAKNILSKRADQVCKLMHNQSYKDDLWMWDQDWSVQPIKVKSTLSKTKKQDIEKKLANDKTEESDFEKYLTDGEEEIDPLEEEFRYLWETRNFLPLKLPHMSGYPAWYRKLCMKHSEENWKPGPQNISTTMQITPKLLNLTWENYPLHYIREHGWGFLMPYNDDPNVQTNLPIKKLLNQCPLPQPGPKRDEIDYAMSTLRTDVQDNLTKNEFWRHKKKKKQTEPPHALYNGSGIWCNVIIDDCCWFLKLPHKNGASNNVGNPLARDFLIKFSDNVLAGFDSSATEILKIARTLSYWRNNRDRIMSQMVVWLKEENLPFVARKSQKRMHYGAIIPLVVVNGTLTRRATESTWMTASNASTERIGSELRAMVQAPPGYNIVGADVDSQELWIASVLGDSYCAGIHGATPFGWMTLIGTKTKSTDMHSVTAKAVGISRDHAKVINYARIYGAGQKFAERLLKQFNPTMSESEATTKSRKMFSLTKGKKYYRLKPEYIDEDTVDRNYTSWEAYQLAKVNGKKTEEMFNSGQWTDGTESAMFNRLEEIAGMKEPVTPFLNSRLTRALESHGGSDDKYLPTKVNWVVQSGAVDFLHLMLVSMRWLMRDNARFCLSFHDEVRYIVPAKFKYNAALAMHVTNLLTRAFCSSRLGIKDLPMSVAFFASVEVDTVLRKESSLDCKTPSNPHGLQIGYSIPPGESLDVWKTIEKSGVDDIIPIMMKWMIDQFGFTQYRDSCLSSALGGILSLLRLTEIMIIYRFYDSCTMSKATKRKHVTKELQENVIEVPNNEQSIVRLIDSRGNNLHEIVDAEGERYLVSMPVKFRRNIWVKRGDFVIVEPIAEGDKVKAEIVKILTRDHIKFYKSQDCWPTKFNEKEISADENITKTTHENENAPRVDDDDDDLFVNTNRNPHNLQRSRINEDSNDSSESD